jgi:DNA-binding MarR family transcriptional regulator
VNDSPYHAAAAVRETLRTFARRTEEITRRNGLTPRGYTLLLLVETGRELPGRATPDELEERLQLAKSTVAELLQRNEASGLVRRELHPTRRGGIVISLTAKGRRLLDRAFDELGPERERLLHLLDEAKVQRERA